MDKGLIYTVTGAISLILIYKYRSKLLQNADDIYFGNSGVRIVTSDGAINNFTNIRQSNSAWLGLISSPSNSFVSFADPSYSVRATKLILENYMNKDNVYSLSDAIARWAPSNENDTATYLQNVVNNSGIPANTPLQSILSDETQTSNLIYAMAVQENGQQIASNLTQNILNTGYNLA